MSSYIQLPYGVVDRESTMQMNNPKDFETSRYLKRLPYLDDVNSPKVQNEVLNLINRRDDFKKFLLATSDLGTSLQDSINAVVTDGKFNDVALRRILDKKDSDIFKVSNPLSLVFKNANKFNLQNPVLGNVISQIYAGSLTDEEVKRLLSEGENLKIKARLDELRKFNNRLGDGGAPPNDNNRPPNFNNFGGGPSDDDDEDDDNGGFGDRGSAFRDFAGNFDPDIHLPDVPTTTPTRVRRGQVEKEKTTVRVPGFKDSRVNTSRYSMLNSDFRKIGNQINRSNRNFTIHDPPPIHVAAETAIPHPKLDVRDGIRTFAPQDTTTDKENETDTSIELPDVPTHDISFNKPITRIKDAKKTLLRLYQIYEKFLLHLL